MLAGVGPILSQRALHHLGGLPGVHIPEATADRLLGAGAGSAEKFRAAGEQLCAETIAELVQLPGLAGVHVIAPGGETAIPGILGQAGRTPARPARGDEAGGAADAG